MKKIIKLENLNLNRVNFSYGDIIESEPIRNELEINYFDLGFLCNDSITNFESVLQGLWNSFINLQADNIEKIYNVLIEEYNPLDNYSGETITDYGEIKTTHEKGEQVNTFVKGEQVNTFVKGEQVVNLISGKRKTTLGQATDTQTNYTVNSESANLTNNFNANEKTETNNAQRVNESDSFTDKSTNESYTDTNTNDSYTDTNTNDSYTDTDTTEAYQVKETKHGNLGVTQSQMMVKNEIFLRNKYNFYSIIIKMFVDNYLLFA